MTSVSAAICGNQRHDAGETDLDCGGPCAHALKCNISQACVSSCDCDSGVCVSNVCLRKYGMSDGIIRFITLVLAMSCANGRKDLGETDIDCGGLCALGRKCADYSKCNTSADCVSGVCESTFCLRQYEITSMTQAFRSLIVAAHCRNDESDSTESDIDCGGACAIGLKCDLGQSCGVPGDCASGVCSSNACLRECLFTTYSVQIHPRRDCSCSLQ